MTKRLVEIDDELLAAARIVLDTPTMKATVNEALAEVVATERRRAHMARLMVGDGVDLGDDEVMADAWR